LIFDDRDVADHFGETLSHPIGVLRVHRDYLEQLAETWQRLSERIYRIVLVLVDLDRYDEADFERYEMVLTDLRQRLAVKYLRGEAAELSVLSDRLGLPAPTDCGAGVDHITVVPNGDLHICPGFANDGVARIGTLLDGWQIANQHLLERAQAPICSVCDAFHCRRCVYMHRRATLEFNTPSWQICRAAHMEREASRVMLSALHQRRCMERIRPIPPLDYQDPLERLVQVRHAIPLGASAAPLHEVLSPATALVQPIANGVKVPDDQVGSVSPEERDTILKIHRRRVGLNAVATTLARMDAAAMHASPLYERLVCDMGETVTAYDKWWTTTSIKYGWRREHPDQSWHIDFETCAVFIDHKN
jgi:CXXX repeat modification system protein